MNQIPDYLPNFVPLKVITGYVCETYIAKERMPFIISAKINFHEKICDSNFNATFVSKFGA